MRRALSVVGWFVVLLACAATGPLAVRAEGLRVLLSADTAAPTPTLIYASTPPARDDGTATPSASPAATEATPTYMATGVEPTLPVDAAGTATSAATTVGATLPADAAATETPATFDSPLQTPGATPLDSTYSSPLATPTLSGTVVFVSPLATPTASPTIAPTETAQPTPTATPSPVLTAAPTTSLYPTPTAAPPGNIRVWEYVAAGVIVLAIVYLFARALLRALR